MTIDLPPPSKFSITIVEDKGGMIDAYNVYAEWLRDRGIVVRIDGICPSACTLIAFRAGHVCATGNGVLGFHRASSEYGTKMLWNSYPEKVRNYLRVLTDQLRTVPARKFLPECL